MLPQQCRVSECKKMSPKRIENGVKSSKGGNSIYAYPSGGWVEAKSRGRAHVLRSRMCAGNKDTGGFYSGGFILSYLIYVIGVLNKCTVKSRCGGFCIGWISINGATQYTQFLLFTFFLILTLCSHSIYQCCYFNYKIIHFIGSLFMEVIE